MLEEYQFGEKIDITLISATVYSHDDKHLMVEVGDGSLVSIPTKGASWAIRRRVPVDGVPLVDDLWADKNGERYFATSSGGQVKFIDGDNRFWDWERINIERGPLRLVFRQCSTDPAEAAAEVPEELAPAAEAGEIPAARLDEIVADLNRIERYDPADYSIGDEREAYLTGLPESDVGRSAEGPEEGDWQGTWYLVDGSRVYPAGAGWEWSR